jgi:hypothetical protein
MDGLANRIVMKGGMRRVSLCRRGDLHYIGRKGHRAGRAADRYLSAPEWLPQYLEG